MIPLFYKDMFVRCAIVPNDWVQVSADGIAPCPWMRAACSCGYRLSAEWNPDSWEVNTMLRFVDMQSFRYVVPDPRSLDALEVGLFPLLYFGQCQKCGNVFFAVANWQ